MYCKKCGNEINESDVFCSKCGAKVHPDDPDGKTEEPKQPAEPVKPEKPFKPEKPKNNKGLIAVLIAAAVVVIIFAGYFTVGLNMKKNKLCNQIAEAGVTEFTQQKDMIEGQWKEAGFSPSARQNLLKELDEVKTKSDQFISYGKEIKKMDEQKDQYAFDEEAYSAYEKAVSECMALFEEKSASEALASYDEVTALQDQLITANEAFIKNRVELYQSIDLAEVTDKEKKIAADNIAKLEKMIKEVKTDDYGEYKNLFQKTDEILYMYIDPENKLNVVVQQIDASEFPKIKVYMSISDENTGEIPKDLKSSFFYIKKEDANASFVKQNVITANQLNDKEALKVNMVADVSGSMVGTPLWEAKQTMSNFVNSMQFNAGDMLELTSFATGVRLEQEFTNDAGVLIDDINNLDTGNMTSLYDALYTAVGRVAAQSGARCVIAFTDGRDNYSNCSADDVIALATRYHIPVFIIGIDTGDYYEVSNIAYSTGGAYYDIQDVLSMQSIYDEIYRMEKELYVLEFEDTTGALKTDESNIQVGYHSLEYGGECAYKYVPNILLSVDASTYYTDGPEAVVERYLHNFDDAMSNEDFSYIEDCLLPGSSIYDEQKEYVKQGIKEKLSSYEIVSVDYSDSENCVVTTRETFSVQIQGEPLFMMTQQCKYNVVKSGSDWKMSGFADQVEVLSKINQ